MPRYIFTGEISTVLVGLIQGTNATLIPAAGNPIIEPGATIVVSKGDLVDTGDRVYNAAILEEEVEAPAPVVETPAVETAPAAPVAPVTPAETAPAVDPAAAPVVATVPPTV